MGLENLTSVFSDISKNEITEFAKSNLLITSRLDDIENNIIRDSNIGGRGELRVLDFPPEETPLSDMGPLDFREKPNVLIFDRISAINSPVSDMSEDASNFGLYSPFPVFDSIFQNDTIMLLGRQSLIEDDPHTFGTGGLLYTQADINSWMNTGTNDEYSIRLPDLNYPGGPAPQRIDKDPNLGISDTLGNGLFKFETLYNVNHTAVPIENRITIDYGRVKINTLRAGMGSLGNLDIMGYSSDKLGSYRGKLRGAEPYIVKDVNSLDYQTMVDFVNTGRIADDESRLSKFYNSDAGTADYNLSFGNISHKTFYDVTMNEYSKIHQHKHLFQKNLKTIWGDVTTDVKAFFGMGKARPSFAKLGDRMMNFDFSVKLGSGEVVRDVWVGKQTDLRKKSPFIDLGGGLPESNWFSLMSRGGLESRPFGKDSYNVIDKINRQRPVTQDKLTHDWEIAPTNQGDFYVRLNDLRTNTFLYFRGFVTGISENVNPSWTSANYIGRSEPVYLYERAERDLSFNLRVYPNNNREFQIMYEKIDHLTSMAYPQYMNDRSKFDKFWPFTESQQYGWRNSGGSLLPTDFQVVDYGESNQSTGGGDARMKPPFAELYMGHIGTRAKGQFGFIKSLSYTVNDSADWDQEKQLPRLFDIAISYQILNKRPSALGTAFYGPQQRLGQSFPDVLKESDIGQGLATGIEGAKSLKSVAGPAVGPPAGEAGIF